MTVPPSLLDPLAEQSAVMAGLEKFTSYNITVLCFTDPGDGLRSQPVEVRTDEDGKLSCMTRGEQIPDARLPRHGSLVIYINSPSIPPIAGPSGHAV